MRPVSPVPLMTAAPRAPARPAPPRRPNWWLRLTSYGWDRPLYTVEQRERVRRSRLMSWILLGLLAVNVVLIPLGAGDPSTLIAIVVMAATLVISIGLNRIGFTSVAGSLLILIICAAIMAVIVTIPQGLTLDALPAYDLLVMSVVIAASVLPRGAAFVVAALNISLMTADFLLQPHYKDVQLELAYYGGTTSGTIFLLARPIALQVIIAVVAFLWVRSTDEAIRRADRAEELAALEHQLAEQKRQLDIGVQELLATHIRAANGDFSARAPLRQDNILWQIASSLNNLLARMQRTAQAEHRLVRTEEELRRIAGAIDEARAGRPPFWPMPTGTAADLILERIARDQHRAPVGAGFGAPALPSQGRGAPFAPGYGPGYGQGALPSGPSQPLTSGGFGPGGFGQGDFGPGGFGQGGLPSGFGQGGFGAPVPPSQPAGQPRVPPAPQPPSTSLDQSPANDRWHQPTSPLGDQPPLDRPSAVPARPSAPSSPIAPAPWMLSQDELAREGQDQPPDWPELPPVGEWTVPTDG